MSIFDNVAFPKHKRNVFNLSHTWRSDAAFGKLIPCLCHEVFPGDTFQITTQSFVRAMPMLAPLMHQVDIYTHFFFVPNRLVWDNWKEFITGGEDGISDVVFPYIHTDRNDGTPGSLADYLGYGAHLGPDRTPIASYSDISAIPFRAYALIWNEYYRDQNLQEELPISKGDGLDNTTPREILLRNWQKDYFTSALPWLQRGPNVETPLNGYADVDINISAIEDDGVLPRYIDSSLNNASAGNARLIERDNTNMYSSGNDEAPLIFDPNGTLFTSFRDSHVGIDINELRRSIALQRWFETNARGGSRYIEQIFSHFGVKSSDARLQRPEFLGGGKQPLSISEVLQTSQSTDNSSLGNMAGHGVSGAVTKQFRRYFEEHGYIIGIVSIMPKTSYMQGTARHLCKFDRFDYAWPEFANLGEQEVWSSEVYQRQGPAGAGSGTFGYQSRYAEYKQIPNSVHGELKNDAFAPWTLVRKFAQQPYLNSEFIDVDYEAEGLGRIFPVTDSDTQFIIQMYHDIKAIRILPKHTIPSI